MHTPRYAQMKTAKWGLHALRTPLADLAIQLANQDELLQNGGTFAVADHISSDVETAHRQTDPENAYLAAHFEQLTQTVQIEVPDQVQLTKPLLVDWQPTTPGNGNFHFSIRLGKNSRATVIITQKAGAIGLNSIGEIAVGADAQLEVAELNLFDHGSRAYFHQNANLDRNAALNWSIAQIGTGNVLGEFNTELNGTGASANIQAVSLAKKDEHIGLQTTVGHHAPHTTSRILQHGALFAQAETNLNAIGKIDHGAHGADAQQESRLLLLDPSAQGNANPILLIDENDVQAGHAASVGQVDLQQLYYLMSRGLTKETAENILVRSFLAPVLSSLPAGPIADQVDHLLGQRLGGIDPNEA